MKNLSPLLLAGLALTALSAIPAHAQGTTEDQGAQIFDQLDVGGFGKDDSLDLTELKADNLKWLQYDTNYNNQIEKREFMAGYAQGIPRLRPTDEEALRLFHQEDTDKDGYLSIALPAYAKYKAYDPNGDNIIGANEFLAGCAKEGSAQTAPPLAPPSPAPALPTQWKAGDAVEYEWNGNWYPATVLGIQDGQYQIHFKDWPQDSFELVAPARVRPSVIAPPNPPQAAVAPDIIQSATSPSEALPSGPFKIGDIVESTNREGNWDKSHINAAKIIGIQDHEPLYHLRSFNGMDGSRDYFAYSQKVRRPVYAVYDEYDLRLLLGSWRIGTSATTSTTVTGERDTSIGTEATERTEHTAIASKRVLTIKANHTWMWKPTSTETLTGNWIESNNPDYPLILKKAYHGHDWSVGPHGKEKGVFNIRVQDLSIGNVLWGPPIGQAASLPPILAAKPNAPQEPVTRWKIGGKVRAKWGTEWRMATIVEMEDGQYKVHYDGALTDTWDAWFKESELRPK